MRRAYVSTVLVLLFAGVVCFANAESVRAKANSTDRDAATGFIQPKWKVTDDPLDGLPGDSQPRGRGKDGARESSKASCAVHATPANPRAIGDLRATLAFVRGGPQVWSCPARASITAQLQLRIAIAGAGRITGVETVAGDSRLGSAMARRLTGKTIASRRDGATVGEVVIALVNAR